MAILADAERDPPAWGVAIQASQFYILTDMIGVGELPAIAKGQELWPLSMAIRARLLDRRFVVAGSAGQVRAKQFSPGFFLMGPVAGIASNSFHRDMPGMGEAVISEGSRAERDVEMTGAAGRFIGDFGPGGEPISDLGSQGVISPSQEGQGVFGVVDCATPLDQPEVCQGISKIEGRLAGLRDLLERPGHLFLCLFDCPFPEKENFAVSGSMASHATHFVGLF